ncbi:hypothetical protein MMC30_009366, partial [Trapelia coarctata]|nr:hypothetical protein [Trapelia coarctata]
HHPKAAWFRQNTLSYIEILDELFGESAATRAAAQTAQDFITGLQKKVETEGFNKNFDLNNIDPALQDLLASSDSLPNLPSPPSFDNSAFDTQETLTSVFTPIPTPSSVSRDTPIKALPRKKRKEMGLSGESLAALKAALDKGNELLSQIITAEPKNEIVIAVKTLVKDYNNQDSEWLQKAIKVSKQIANAQVFNYLKDTQRNVFIMAEVGEL